MKTNCLLSFILEKKIMKILSHFSAHTLGTTSSQHRCRFWQQHTNPGFSEAATSELLRRWRAILDLVPGLERFVGQDPRLIDRLPIDSQCWRRWVVRQSKRRWRADHNVKVVQHVRFHVAKQKVGRVEMEATGYVRQCPLLFKRG